MQEVKEEVKKKDWKNDRLDGKLRWELLPLDLIEDLVKVYDKGAQKYEPDSWKQVENGYARYKGALLRHLVKSETEDIDEETECYHLAQVAWNALTMLWFKKQELNNTIKVSDSDLQCAEKLEVFHGNIDSFVNYSKETFGDLNHLTTHHYEEVLVNGKVEKCEKLKPVYIKGDLKNYEGLDTCVNITVNDTVYKLYKADFDNINKKH